MCVCSCQYRWKPQRVMLLYGSFSHCVYRPVSMKVGLVSEELPLFLTFVGKNVITWLSNQWMSLLIAEVRKVLSVAPSGCNMYFDQVELEGRKH